MGQKTTVLDSSKPQGPAAASESSRPLAAASAGRPQEQEKPKLQPQLQSKIDVRLLVIGAGSRGNAYAKAAYQNRFATVAGVAEPDAFKRNSFGTKYVWGVGQEPTAGQSFEGWREFVEWELARRETNAGEGGFDAVFVCTQDEMHYEIVMALIPLGLHIMCEKPLTTTLKKNIEIYKELSKYPATIFGIGHVLRYSPHNLTLKKLLLDDKIIGDIISFEHTEPVGFWHFAHSYVRGNWHRVDESAPSLLTKSCHDLDLLLWLMCVRNGSNNADQPPHLPSTVSSMGSLIHFRQRNKPKLAGSATNCLSCPAEPECKYSAKRIYVDQALRKGNTGWPVKIVVPEIEDLVKRGSGLAEKRLLEALSRRPEDAEPGSEERFYGQCVYEHDNDVCDDQFVTMTWDDEISSPSNPNPGSAKFAQLHMVAFTEKICERRSRIYGSEGEIEADSRLIKVYNFTSGKTTTFTPEVPEGGHGGGDAGLCRAFVEAVRAVKSEELKVEDAQQKHVGCSIKDIILSHAMAFAAEEARKTRTNLDFIAWWKENVVDS